MSHAEVQLGQGRPEERVPTLLQRVHARLADRAGLLVTGEVERASYRLPSVVNPSLEAGR
jgi:hypothetical protein